MKYNYICTKNTCFNEDIGEYISYGVSLEGDAAAKIDDLSPNAKAVAAFAKKLNEHQLCPIHLFEAAEDFTAT